MTDYFETVPLIKHDSEMPAFDFSGPNIVTAEVTLSSPLYQTVQLGDISRIEEVPLVPSSTENDSWR